MSIKDVLARGVHNLLHPTRFGRTESELAAAMYDDNNAKQMQKGEWYQHVNTEGIRTAFTYACPCGESHYFLESEKFRDYICPVTKKPLNFAVGVGLKLSHNKEERFATLRRFAGILVEADWSSHETDGDWLPRDKEDQVLSLLPARPSFGRNTGGPRVISTWDNEPDGSVEYEQADPGKGGGFN